MKYAIFYPICPQHQVFWVMTVTDIFGLSALLQDTPRDLRR